MFIYRLISELFLVPQSSHFLLPINAVFKRNMEIFLGSIIWLSLGSAVVFCPFSRQGHCHRLCGVVATPGSLSGREWICILIRCKGESNIAHYFHVLGEAAVVLHHCELSAVWIPQEEVCVCVGGWCREE